VSTPCNPARSSSAHLLLLLCFTQLFYRRLTAALLLAEQVRHWLSSAVRVCCNGVVPAAFDGHTAVFVTSLRRHACRSATLIGKDFSGEVSTSPTRRPPFHQYTHNKAKAVAVLEPHVPHGSLLAAGPAKSKLYIS